MNFTTQITIPQNNFLIDFSSEIITLGSCFSDEMGAKFNYFKFKVNANPFGVVFNPKSIENLIKRAVNEIWFTENDLVFHNELWHSFDVHSDFSSVDKDLILNRLNNTLNLFITHLKMASHVYITFGTSWVYVLHDSNKIVSNCHKLPQSHFTKKLLTVQEIESSIRSIFELVKKVNPECNIVFTVSPVRHIKDGFVENQRSKSHLITAIHNEISSQNNYFPSFEIMMDELRDYRFYAPDMLHPSTVAIDYIWQKFAEVSINSDLTEVLLEIDSVQKSLAHKPFNPETENHQKFLKNLNKKIETIQKIVPNATF
jgi:hypothetical protein